MSDRLLGPSSQSWTNVYDEIGGDMRWNEDMEEMVKDRGLDGDVQPFFGMCSYTVEAVFLMQVGGNDIIFWNAVEDFVYRINGNLTPEKIVTGLNEDGFGALKLGEI